MADTKKLNDEELDKVSGGLTVIPTLNMGDTFEYYGLSAEHPEIYYYCAGDGIQYGVSEMIPFTIYHYSVDEYIKFTHCLTGLNFDTVTRYIGVKSEAELDATYLNKQ